MKILIIEDDEILSDTIKQCVKKTYEVEQAFDGEEGVLYAEQDIYDVIILDLMIPIMDGYDVLLTLRKKKIYTPVLILTAKGELNDKLKGFKSGADDYLVKPFEKEELLARLEALVRRNYSCHYIINSCKLFIKPIYTKTNHCYMEKTNRICSKCFTRITNATYYYSSKARTFTRRTK